MRLFPMFVSLAGRQVLVVGGGEVATRKVESLLQSGAEVRICARALSAPLRQWRDAGRLAHVGDTFDESMAEPAWLLVAATDDEALNAQVAACAERLHRWVNVVDDAERSTYQVPALIDRSPLLVAISSAGAAPMLARRLREWLETSLDASYGTFAGLFARHRQRIRERLPDLALRRRWFEGVMDGPVQPLLRAGEDARAEAAFLAQLEDGDASGAGSVVLVGTGPGGEGLLTLKALREMNRADLLLVDPEVCADVLERARRDATRVTPADEAAALSLAIGKARAGEHVVWLTPGDGFAGERGVALNAAIAAADLPCLLVRGVAR